MRTILVIERKHLFPGLSPQGFLSPDAVDLDGLGTHLFFAERDYMEHNSHYKQLIPYLMLQRGTGDDARVLCYQRRTKHTEARLGGLWSVGFGGHIEPLDRDDATVKTNGLVLATALREMEEETGLNPGADALTMTGFINSDADDVSSVHFGVVFRVDLDGLDGTDAALMELVSAQAEPHRALWLPASELVAMTGPGQAPDGGTFETWSAIAVAGTFG
ncbi:NUDIX domain-containing protein [bacterium]|nr:NUDIX domain-containing protein [bacterium]